MSLQTLLRISCLCLIPSLNICDVLSSCLPPSVSCNAFTNSMEGKPTKSLIVAYVFQLGLQVSKCCAAESSSVLNGAMCSRWLAQLMVNVGHPHSDPAFAAHIVEPTVIQA